MISSVPNVVDRGEPALYTGERRRVFRRTYGTIPNGAEPVKFANPTDKIPDSPPAERSRDRKPSIARQVTEPPEFARLTHLSDGTPFKQHEHNHSHRQEASASKKRRSQAENGRLSQAETDGEDEEERGEEEEGGMQGDQQTARTAEQERRRTISRASQDPEHNPWF